MSNHADNGAKKKRKRDEDEETVQEKKHKSEADHIFEAKCESIEKWGREFNWSVLDRVPVFGGNEENLFRFGKQIEQVLDLVGFPKGILELDAETNVDTDEPDRATTDVTFTLAYEFRMHILGLYVKEEAIPAPFDAYNEEDVPSIVSDIFSLIWRHAFPAQTRVHREDELYYKVIGKNDADTNVNFASPEVFNPTTSDFKYKHKSSWVPVFECEHCVHALVVRFCPLSPSVARIVTDYYVFT